MSEFPTTTAESGAVIISPKGRLNMVSAPALRDELHAQVQRGNATLVVDLSDVELIDSAGLSALISGLKVARQAGGNLTVAKASKQVRSILRLTSLHRVLGLGDFSGGSVGEPD